MSRRPKKKVLVKIIIIGDSGVGKTAILHKYVTGNFIQEHKATIGADFLTKEINVEDKVVTLQVISTHIHCEIACYSLLTNINKKDMGHCRSRKISEFRQCILSRSGCVHYGL